MKFFVDLSKKQLIKSAASNVALERVVLKRRDSLAVEVIFVTRNAVATMPEGTTVSVALKKSFADSNFLASASGTPPILNLNTVPLEALFSASNPSAIPALLEVRWTVPGETTRTATLTAEVQNSVILGTEGTPEAIPDGKATQAEAQAGTNNEKWMTPLRTAQAIAVLAPPPTWDAVQNKPATFPPSSHGHAISEVTGLQTSLDSKADLLPGALTPVVRAAVELRSEEVPDELALKWAPQENGWFVEDPASFRAAIDAAPAPTTSANSGLAISGNSLATSYNSTIADSVVSVPVGGAPAAAASSWKSKNLVQVLDDILFPTLLATVGTAKSINLTVSGQSGTLEIGSSHSRTLTADFNRGTILNGNGTTNSNPLVGPATTYTFTGTGISSTAQAGNTLTFTAAIVSGTNNWAVTAAHSAGTGTYTDNKGVPGTNLDAQRAAGTATDSTSSPTITGVHPYYYLKSASPISASAMVTAIQNGTASKVIATSTGTLSIPYAPTAEYFAVAYPSTSTTKTRYFVTALDNGAITVVFAPVSTQSVTTDLWTQDYRIHVSAAALTNSNPTIELRNT